MIKKKIFSLLLALLLFCSASASLSACNPASTKDPQDGETTAADPNANPDSTKDNQNSADSSDASASDANNTNDANGEKEDVIDYEFSFAGSDFRYTGTPEHEIDGNSLILKKSGTYRFSGTMSDGSIVVDIPKEERLTLLLDNFTASCSNSAVIYVKSADRVYLDLKKGTVNTLTDASEYVFKNAGDTKPNACIYSADDLTIKGGGTLIVNANYNNGIGSKDDIVIKNGTVTVTAVNNAIKGNKSVTVKGDAQVNVLACKDAIKTDSLNEGKGFILITEEAELHLVANKDILQASQAVTVSETAHITYTAGGEPVKCDGTVNVAEGSMTQAE